MVTCLGLNAAGVTWLGLEAAEVTWLGLVAAVVTCLGLVGWFEDCLLLLLSGVGEIFDFGCFLVPARSNLVILSTNTTCI